MFIPIITNELIYPFVCNLVFIIPLPKQRRWDFLIAGFPRPQTVANQSRASFAPKCTNKGKD